MSIPWMHSECQTKAEQLFNEYSHRILHRKKCKQLKFVLFLFKFWCWFTRTTFFFISFAWQNTNPNSFSCTSCDQMTILCLLHTNLNYIFRRALLLPLLFPLLLYSLHQKPSRKRNEIRKTKSYLCHSHTTKLGS